jgi:hypothetical protein
LRVWANQETADRKVPRRRCNELRRFNPELPDFLVESTELLLPDLSLPKRLQLNRRVSLSKHEAAVCANGTVVLERMDRPSEASLVDEEFRDVPSVKLAAHEVEPLALVAGTVAGGRTTRFGSSPKSSSRCSFPPSWPRGLRAQATPKAIHRTGSGWYKSVPRSHIRSTQEPALFRSDPSSHYIAERYQPGRVRLQQGNTRARERRKVVRRDRSR